MQINTTFSYKLKLFLNPKTSLGFGGHTKNSDSIKNTHQKLQKFTKLVFRVSNVSYFCGKI